MLITCHGLLHSSRSEQILTAASDRYQGHHYTSKCGCWLGSVRVHIRRDATNTSKTPGELICRTIYSLIGPRNESYVRCDKEKHGSCCRSLTTNYLLMRRGRKSRSQRHLSSKGLPCRKVRSQTWRERY
eukprot:scaffold20531_cov67-Cyclotella_meneghiniana.AAC.5